MFQFAGFPPQHYGIPPFHPAVHEGSSCGFPHSDTCGSMDMCSSPQLFAACRVFLRLLVPRHPPCALLMLNLSSYGSFCFLGSSFLFSCFSCFRYFCLSMSLSSACVSFLIQYSVFKVQLPSAGFLSGPRLLHGSPLTGLKWTRTTDLTLIRRAL